jgi:hypothetical protein
MTTSGFTERPSTITCNNEIISVGKRSQVPPMERAYRSIDRVDVGPRFSGRCPIRFYLRVDSPETKASQIKGSALFLCLSCPRRVRWPQRQHRRRKPALAIRHAASSPALEITHTPKILEYRALISSLLAATSAGSQVNILIDESGVRPAFSRTSLWKECCPNTSVNICCASRLNR